MLHLRNLKLKHQLALLICIGIVTMSLIQFFYYFRFYYLTQDKAKVYAANIMSQMKRKMDYTAESIKKAADAAAYNITVQRFLTAEDNLQKLNYRESVASILISIIELNPYICDIGLVNNDGDLIISSDNAKFDLLVYRELKKQFDNQRFDQSFFSPVIQVIQKNREVAYYCYVLPVFNTMPEADLQTRVGTLVVLSRPQQLNDVVMNTSISQNSLFCIVDSKNTVVVSNREGMEGKIFDAASYMDNIDAYRHADIDTRNRESLMSSEQIEEMQWKIISIIPIHELTSELREVRSSGIFIGTIAAIILMAVGFLFSRNITNPISQIVGMIEKIGETNIKQRLNANVTNEIGVIAKDINKMLDKIEHMTSNIFNMQTRLYEMELSKKEAELSALQSQINPHFLYNTLECIRSIGLANGIQEIVSISTSMARIFRYSIKGGNFTTVREEIECIQDYLNIMRIRYMGKFDIRIKLDEKMLDIPIIKMILQPIVENAVYHGLEQKLGQGNVYVVGSMENSRLVFEIIDDGIGMSEQELEKLNSLDDSVSVQNLASNSKRGIGLSNINNRIKLYYGDQYSIKIYSRKNEGTRVVVEIPVLKDN